MRITIILIALISLLGCKPKDKPTETPDNSKQEQRKNEEHIAWSKRINLGEQLVSNYIDPSATNIQFQSHYKHVGDNDGYVCGTVSWIDTFSQKKVGKYFYIYLSFANGSVLKSSKPIVFENSESYPMEKYNMFCSLS